MAATTTSSSTSSSTLNEIHLDSPDYVVEFYSGIGGMHYGLQLAHSACRVSVSMDINTLANAVYTHNFPDMRVYSRSIEGLKPDDHLINGKQGVRSVMWLMSPPCQPFSRLGLQRDDQDKRCRSLLHLIDILPKLLNPPDYILLENVKGFDVSRTRTILLEQLRECDYTYQEFLLSPDDFGIPNRRLRYFLLAKRKPKRFLAPHLDGQLQTSVPGVSHAFTQGQPCKPLADYLEHPDSPEEHFEAHKVPLSIIEKSGFLMDIVTPEQKLCRCFTKSYGRFVEGTGSVLQLAPKEVSQEPAQSWEDLAKWQLRFFTPREIANLHRFPSSFSFPSHFTPLNCYRLLGNSLNVEIVAALLTYLLQEGPPLEPDDAAEPQPVDVATSSSSSEQQ